ncbi:MAG: 50S ribosomal protein L6 [Gammaproteobacteria bacterium]
MSRIANVPVAIPAGVEVDLSDDAVGVKGPKGSLNQRLHRLVVLERDGEQILCRAKVTEGKSASSAVAMAGTTRALVQNMVTGVSNGFEKKLQLVGVGYRAQMKGKSLNLALGYSHPINYEPPEGVELETPSQTEILVKGIDKQKVGQAAAVIRSFRKPEPYKGKGVKYANEHIVRKEAKKK